MFQEHDSRRVEGFGVAGEDSQCHATNADVAVQGMQAFGSGFVEDAKARSHAPLDLLDDLWVDDHSS